MPRRSWPSSRMRPDVGSSKPASILQQRRLSAAGRAEQREELALVDRQRQIVDGGEVAEPLGDVLEGDVGLGVGSFHGAKCPADAAKRFHDVSVLSRASPLPESEAPAVEPPGLGSGHWPVTILVQARVTRRCVLGS